MMKSFNPQITQIAQMTLKTMKQFKKGEMR
jgi:hypothetical protein